MTCARDDRFASAVGLLTRDHAATFAFGIVKQTIGHGQRDLPPEPLSPDPDVHGRGVLLEPATDYAFDKPLVDVVVQGDVVRTSDPLWVTTSVAVGYARRRIAVTGPRVLERRRGHGLVPSEPAEWTRVPMAWAHAYGGYDGRVRAPRPISLPQAMVGAFDHPGLYPRNPFGKGYAVIGEGIEGMPLPQLEDPDHLLGTDGLVARTPERWYLQPRPACWSWAWPVQFPRYAWWGMQPWNPAPYDERLAEIAAGDLPLALPRLLEGDPSLRRRFWNTAAPGLSFAELATGTPLSVSGMHDRVRTFAIEIPAPPRAVLRLDGQTLDARPRLVQVVLEPNLLQAQLTWHVVARLGGARWVPGIHATIPLALVIDGSVAVAYEAPPVARNAR